MAEVPNATANQAIVMSSSKLIPIKRTAFGVIVVVPKGNARVTDALIWRISKGLKAMWPPSGNEGHRPAGGSGGSGGRTVDLTTRCSGQTIEQKVLRQTGRGF